MNGEQLKYWSLQGTVDLMDRVSGNPVGGFWLGDCSSISYSAEPQEERFKENHTGFRTDGLVIAQGVEATLEITMHNINMRNLELMVAGDTVAQDTDAVVGKVVTGATPVVGQTFLLGAFDVTAVTITDSTAVTPVELTPGVNYTLDAKTGRGVITNLTTGGPFVGPLKASYTPGAVSWVKMLTNTERERWIHITSKNTVNGQARMAFDFYRGKIAPTSLQLINESRGEGVLRCALLGDDTKDADGDLGVFGRAIILD